jgi:hypothetical protein
LSQNNQIQKLNINKDIHNLNLSAIGSNLLFYSYHISFLKKLIAQNKDQEDPQYISSFSSFKGEIYENIIYELLLRYAITHKDITSFILKGPHQNKNVKNGKIGLQIDKNAQIVYKSGYKDISEFDGMFFTEDSVYFVESTIVNTTSNLRKRLRKKKAILETLFPKLKVKALIILTDGATGTNVFPAYCTVWVTKDFDANGLLEKILKKEKGKFKKVKSDKFVEVSSLDYYHFKYFDTLKFLLKKAHDVQSHKINLRFLRTNKVRRYFDIFTKIYIGYINEENFKALVPNVELEINDNIIYVVIEQKDNNKFAIVYYLRTKNKKLKRVEVLDNRVDISDKDPKGFTNSEIKFMSYIITPAYSLHKNSIKYIEKSVTKWKSTDR